MKRKLNNENSVNKRQVKCTNFSDSCRLYEYTSAANPNIEEIPIKSFGSELYNTNKTHITKLDIFSDIKTTYSATSPNLLANFVEILSNVFLCLKLAFLSSFFYSTLNSFYNNFVHFFSS